MRHAAAHPQREPEDRLRDAWALDHSHNPRHLFARAAEHARPGRSRNGRGPIVAYCCRIAAKAPGIHAGGFPLSERKMAYLKGFSEYRRSGSNRHGAFAPPDFESGASTNSATPAREPHHYTNVQRSFGARSVLP